ncbi:hypothetical protein [Duganella phyllosphaerae]|uniref:Uncharacterized protein n=1 Tax=Duganella phyllosphaerae TaxID=762836 RepID=A0A1E7W699_9BURK|nr:hypothetical protein [Duganella phyllosphaerae]OEZ91492.1 hypothetical protein DUPY_51040 [Duganella phyllosphaerae]
MTTAQLSFDFDATVAVAPQPGAKGKRRAPKLELAEQEAERLRMAAYWQAKDAEDDAEARAYWSVGMVTSLPLWCEVQDSSQKYTQMLPGVVESIDGDLASVRIYASPEYGCWLENYPIHRKLAINVRLRELGRYGLSEGLQRVVDSGLLATGDAAMAAEVRGREIAQRV